MRATATALFLSFILLAIGTPAFAQAEVEPAAGTIGTEVTITGESFGDKKSKVYVEYDKNGKTKKMNLKVVTWSDDRIEADWTGKVAPGTYPLFVQPKKADPIAVGTFSVRAPANAVPATAGGEPKSEVRLDGLFIGTSKNQPKLTFHYVNSKGKTASKSAKVDKNSIEFDPTTGLSSLVFTVPKLSDKDMPATGTLTLKTKIAEVDVEGTFTVGPVQTGSISGSLFAAPESGIPLTVAGSGRKQPNRWRKGEVLVELSSGTIEALVKRHPKLRLKLLGSIDTLSTHRLSTRNVDRALADLADDAAVASVDRNWLVKAAAEPDDPLYGRQWHYENMNLPAAWEMTTGDASIVVAVVDSGIIDHEDLNANILLDSGYDFVSSGQGDDNASGPDPDPTDTGSYHGTHVAGTIGAVSDNGIGLAGVNWRVSIIPIRTMNALGTGSTYDIANGILYASGIKVSGVPKNPTPARVINMSLGIEGVDSPVMRNAIEAAAAEGVILVGSAGNTGAQTPNYPAAYPEVISVAALNQNNERAYYSTWGSTIEISAPGGEMLFATSDTGVLSTYRGKNDEPYAYLQGTSMAAPHITGLAALMLSVNPDLTADEVRSILQTTAVDLGSEGKDVYYGYGLADAAAAIRAAQSTEPAGEPEPLVTPSELFFDNGVNQASVIVRNAGSGELTVTNVTAIEDDGSGWLSAVLDGPDTPATVTVQSDATGLDTGTYEGRIEIETSAGTETVDVVLTVEEDEDQDPATANDVGPAQVVLRDTDGNIVAEVEADSDTNYAYSFTDVPPGEYVVSAVTGFEDGRLDMEDYVGEYTVVGEPTVLQVGVSGDDITGIDVPMSRADTLGEIPGAGANSISGSLSVRVIDRKTGRPISRATVFLGDGLISMPVDKRGRALFTSLAFGPQTVTVVAPSYDVVTYDQMNAQLMTFQLTRTPGAPVTVTVEIRGMKQPELGGSVGVGREWVPFIWDGATRPRVEIQVPSGQANITVTTVVYDGALKATRIGHDVIGPYTSTPTDPVEIYPEYPDQWRPTSPIGSVTLPAGNFDSSSVDYSMRIYSREEAEFPRLLGISKPGASNDFVLRREFFGRVPEREMWGFQIYGATDANGASTYHYIRDWLGNLPGGIDVGLLDVPELTAPLDGGTVNTQAPTLFFDLPVDGDFAVLSLRQESTGRDWRIIMAPDLTSYALPAIPESPIRFGENYQWRVTGVRIPGEAFHEYRFDRHQASSGDISETPRRLMQVR